MTDEEAERAVADVLALVKQCRQDKKVLECASKGALKDRAVQAARKILAGT